MQSFSGSGQITETAVMWTILAKCIRAMVNKCVKQTGSQSTLVR